MVPKSRKLCTIVLPWGKFEYQKLPMGLCNSPDIFQEKMNELFHDLESDHFQCYYEKGISNEENSIEREIKLAATK